MRGYGFTDGGAPRGLRDGGTGSEQGGSGPQGWMGPSAMCVFCRLAAMRMPISRECREPVRAELSQPFLAPMRS